MDEEERGFLFPDLVVAAEGEEVAHLLVKALFRRPYLADAGEEFVEVVPAAGAFQALVVHDEAFDDQLAKLAIGPATELGATGRFDPEPDSQNGFQIVVGHVVGSAVGGSCPEIPDNCVLVEFAFLEKVLEVFVDGFLRPVEQLSHERLRQPDGRIYQPTFNPGPAILGLVNDQIACGFVAHLATPSCWRIFRRASSVSRASASMTFSSSTISAMGR